MPRAASIRRGARRAVSVRVEPPPPLPRHARTRSGAVRSGSHRPSRHARRRPTIHEFFVFSARFGPKNSWMVGPSPTMTRGAGEADPPPGRVDPSRGSVSGAMVGEGRPSRSPSWSAKADRPLPRHGRRRPTIHEFFVFSARSGPKNSWMVGPGPTMTRGATPRPGRVDPPRGSPGRIRSGRTAAASPSCPDSFRCRPVRFAPPLSSAVVGEGRPSPPSSWSAKDAVPAVRRRSRDPSPPSSWSAKADHPRVFCFFRPLRRPKKLVDGRAKPDHDEGGGPLPGPRRSAAGLTGPYPFRVEAPPLPRHARTRSGHPPRGSGPAAGDARNESGHDGVEAPGDWFQPRRTHASARPRTPRHGRRLRNGRRRWAGRFRLQPAERTARASRRR